MPVHVLTEDCNLLEALQRRTAWLCRTQPSRHETNVVQLARFGAITVQTSASFGTDGDHQVALAFASTSTTALREMIKDHGEHASRRFHFVRDMHHQSLPDLRGQPYRLASQTSGCHSQDMLVDYFLGK